MRAFVAVDLDPEIKGNLWNLICRLSHPESDVKWVKKQGMHITLKFLGEISKNKIPNIQKSIQKVCEDQEVFPLSFRGIGTFPPRSKFPRILWIGVEPSASLAALYRGIETGLERLDFPREKRIFHPHLTLGRVKSKRNILSVLDEMKKLSDSNFGSMQVERVTFFQSNLKSSGAEYSVLAHFQLT